MRNTLLTLLVGILAPHAVTAATPENTAVMTVVQQWWANYTKRDLPSGIALCADEAVIIDDVAPHVWQGAGACAKWLQDDAALAVKEAITETHIVLGKPQHLDVEGGYAYVVVPVTCSYNKSGKPIKEAAIVTMILRKGASGWRISGSTWSKQ